MFAKVELFVNKKIQSVKTSRYVFFIAFMLLFIPFSSASVIPSISIVASDGTAAEVGSTGEFTITLSEPAGDSGLSINYALSGTATAADYTLTPSTIDIPAGASTARLLLTPIVDSEAEGAETVVLTLNEGRDYQLNSLVSATVLIIDSVDTAVTVASIEAIGSAIIEPVNDASITAQPAFTVRLSRAAGDAGVTLFYQVSGNATPGTGDYEQLTGRVFVEPNSSEAVIVVKPLPDSEVEQAENLRLTLNVSPDSSYIVNTASASAEIQIIEAESSGPPLSIPHAIEGALQRTAGLGEVVKITATVVGDNNAPLQGIAVQWQLAQAGITAGGSLADADTFTNDDGQASITLQTGLMPAVYQVTVNVVTAGTNGAEQSLQQTFVITAGLINTVSPNTPEGAIAMTMDSFCPRLAMNAGSLNVMEQALLSRCNELIAAEQAGNTAQVGAALRQIAPEEVATQRRISNDVADQQLDNIAARLSSLRKGAAGLSLSGLALNVNGQVLPGTLVNQWLAPGDRGGSAGDLEFGDADESASGWFDERFGFFIIGSIGKGEKDESKNESGFDFSTTGLTLGADYRLTDTLVLGAALGYANADVDIDNNGGEVDSDSYSFSGYATFFSSDRSYLDAIFSYGSIDYNTLRNINYEINNNTIRRAAKSDTDGKQLSFSFGTGYEFTSQQGFTSEIFGRVNYVSSDVDAYQEKGAQGLNLAIEEQDFQSLVLVLGGQFSQVFNQRWGVLIPQARVSWEHETEEAYTINGRFVNDPFNTNFNFLSDAPDKNYFRLAVGSSMLFANGLSTFIEYETILGRDNYSEYKLSLGARFVTQF